MLENMLKIVMLVKELEMYQEKNEMSITTFLEVELLDIWGMNFMGPFPSSFNNKYILVAVDYVSK